jgi:tetratricopeptide (TPR) repeat protein
MLMDVAPGSAVNAQPDDADFHSNMGNALRQLGKPDAAINGYDEAIKLSPDRVVFHNYRGLALRALNPSSHEALDEYRLAIKLDPKFSAPYYNLANALFDQSTRANGKVEACRLLREGQKVDPSDRFRDGIGNSCLKKKFFLIWPPMTRQPGLVTVWVVLA